MGAVTNLSSIIRLYAEKHNNPFIDFREFCTFVKKYAEKHVEEAADLVKYLGDPTTTISAELTGLEQQKLAATVTNGNKQLIVSISYFSVKYANQYKEIEKNESLPYPIESELPKKFPTHLLDKKTAEDYITKCMENQNIKSPYLYILVFPRELPSLLLPACVPMKFLIETAQKKIRKILKKDEFHDYILKKVRGSNPSKEITIKNFFSHFVDKEISGFLDISDGDDYYLWNQVCYYLRQDFEKIQDRTVEDTNILQAICITEIYSTYLKQKFQNSKRKEEAYKELESNLASAPYFYSSPQILKFQDKNGRLIYGQLSDEEIRNFMQKASTEAPDNELPQLVVFKVASGTHYYIYKNKVIPLVVRLCNEAHESIKDTLCTKWYNSLLNYEKLPEMSDQNKFERCLEAQVESNSPVLYALLNANFMTLIALEKHTDDVFDSVKLFSDGHLLPYSELLMLKKEQILTDAKLQLPLIYTIPVISWIVSLFKAKKANKKKQAEVQNSDNSKNPLEELSEDKHYSKEEALAKQAQSLTEDFIPEGSTIDRELNYLNKQWNKMITKEANMTLTEDVNALIRDYTRRVVRTLSATSFTKERVQNLAETLVKTPNMQKIGEQKALTEYVELYILRLVSNTPKKNK